jgi:protein-L-isoaspartate(D-aspartate) O-methyltransferase
MLLLTRRAADAFAARFIRPVGFVEFAGARDPEAGRRLKLAFGQGDMSSVRSLRGDAHAEDETCWLHGAGWCLSRRDPNPAGSMSS